MNASDRGTVHQALNGDELHERNALEARQGVISGRVVTVLIVSTVALGAIYAAMWWWNFG